MRQVEINLHGRIGKRLRKRSWGVCVENVSEGLHAINKMSGGKLFKLFSEAQKKNQKYKILINDEPWKSNSNVRLDKVYDEGEEEKTKEQIELLRTSELTLKNPKIKKIDIVPVVEGSDEILTIIIAVVLIVIGIMAVVAGHGYGWYLTMAGVGLLAAGITALLMEEPSMDELRTIQGATSSSYLFNGPVNVSREGGPIPVCYGELLVGSQTLSASYDVEHMLASENQITN
jgi:predicted phage tail protein